MGTASDQAPAADISLGAALNLDEAHRRTGIARNALLGAIRDGRLVARRGGVRGSRAMRNAWRIQEADLEAFVEALPTCLSVGCDQPTTNATRICSAHGRAAQTSARMKGVPKSNAHRAKIGAALKGKPKPPEVRAKIAAAKKGQGLGTKASAETRTRISAGLQLFFSTPAGKLERERRASIASRPRADLVERNREAMRTGTATAWALLNWWDRQGGAGRSRRIWKLRWTRSPGRVRSYTDEQATWVLNLAAQGHGHARIAETTGLSRDTVRRIRGRQKRS
jgi:NUMOD3 motif-containing protein